MFEGVLNFREVAGLPRGRLYRSGHPHAATDRDRAVLRALRLDRIIDLRRPAEREAAPSPALDVVTLAAKTGEDIPPYEALLRAGDFSAAAIDDHVSRYYAALPARPAFVKLARALLAALDRNERVLVHCAAGKDRTGMAVAIAQLAAGHSRQAITAEYLRGNHVLADPAARARAIVDLRRLTGREPSPALIDVHLGVSAKYLHVGLDRIELLGGIEAYRAE